MTVDAPTEYRLLLCSAATHAWYDADDAERDRVVARLREACSTWVGLDGVRFIGSVDDDLFLCGDPRGHGRWSAFLLFAADSPERGIRIVDEARRGAPRLDRYFTFSLTVGRAFWPIEAGDDG